MEKQTITEEMKIHEEWYKQAKEMTLANLPEFLAKLTTYYEHDYGTICHAITSAALAAANAVNHSDQGGITGFQAGAIMWEFIGHWNHTEGNPMRLVDYGEFLYPQYETHATSISPEAWEWLQKKAQENLLELNLEYASPEVITHWKSIVSGIVPFGMKVV